MNKYQKEGQVYTTTIQFEHNEYHSFTFKDCRFCGSVIFANLTLGSWAYFENCTFDKEVCFYNCKIKEDVEEFLKFNPANSIVFKKCIIKKIDIRGSSNGAKVRPTFFKRGIMLEETKVDDIYIEYLLCLDNGFIIDKSQISNSLFLRSTKIQSIGLNFFDSNILGKVRLESVDAANYIFINTIFAKDVSLWGGILSGGITFNNGRYDDEFIITAVKCQNLSIIGGIFKQKVTINECDNGQPEVKGGAKQIFIEKSEFCDKVRFNGGHKEEKQHLDTIRIITAKSLVGDISFEGMSVLDEISLEGFNYSGNIQFNNIDTCKLTFDTFINEATMIFQSLHSNQTLNSELKIWNSNLGNTSFLNCDLNSFINIKIEASVLINLTIINVHWFDAQKLNIQETPKNSNYWRKQKEIFRQLKCCMEENMNRPHALIFKSNEMNAYRKSLKLGKKTCSDLILLNLNRLSNNFGLSWITGVIFTVIVWHLCYSVFIMSKEGIAFPFQENCVWLLFDSNYWNTAIQYLWLPDGLNELAELYQMNNSSLSLILGTAFFLLGKVAIAYGIFQVVSAFRKYGKS